MIINTPFSGKLNLDDAEYRVSNNDYIDALNITKDAQGTGQDKVVSNILGNTLIPYTAPAGTNKVIGFYADKVRNRAYYFLWNSGGFNSIIYYDLKGKPANDEELNEWIQENIINPILDTETTNCIR